MSDFKLDEHRPVRSGMITPPEYFEELENIILQRINDPEPKVVPMFPYWKIAAVAAVFVIALLITFTYDVTSQQTIADTETIENYLNNESGLSQYDLLALLDEKDVEALELDLQIEDETIEAILETNSNLEHYITE